MSRVTVLHPCLPQLSPSGSMAPPFFSLQLVGCMSVQPLALWPVSSPCAPLLYCGCLRVTPAAVPAHPTGPSVLYVTGHISPSSYNPGSKLNQFPYAFPSTKAAGCSLSGWWMHPWRGYSSSLISLSS